MVASYDLQGRTGDLFYAGLSGADRGEGAGLTPRHSKNDSNLPCSGAVSPSGP